MDPVLAALAVGFVLTSAWIMLDIGAVVTAWLVQIILDLLFVWFSWQIAISTEAAPLVRRFWRVAAVAGLFFAAGDVVQTALTFGDETVTAETGTAQTILIGVGVALMVWVMLTHPVRLMGRERLKLWLDAATVMCAVAVFVWFLMLSSSHTPSTPGQFGVALLASTLSIASAFALVKLLLSGSAPFSFCAGMIAGIAAAVLAVGTLFNPFLAHVGDVRAILIIRLVPCFLLTASPRIQQLQTRAGGSDRPRRRAPYSRLPYVAVAAAQGLLVVQLWRDDSDIMVWGTVLGVVVITALVMVRQTVAFTDNARLLVRLDASLLKLRRQEQRFRSLVQHSSDITLLLTSDGTIHYASPALERVLGIPPTEAVWSTATQVLRPDDDAAVDRLLAALVADPAGSITTQLRVCHVDRSRRWLELVATNLLDDPSVAGVIVNARDVTEARTLQDRLRHEASHDSLTRLGNRALLSEQMRLVLAQPVPVAGRIAVLVLDLDSFKAVNDLLGHHIGDQLLIVVAERLRHCVRPSDTVARLGGDEFAVLMPATSRSGAVSTALRILTTLSEPVVIEEHTLSARASVGIAVGSSAEVDELLREADTAMYQAKRKQAGVRLHVSERTRPEHAPTEAVLD